MSSSTGGNLGRFRIKEVLGQGIGSVDAVGTSTAVSGSITFDGTNLKAGSFTVDLTKLTTDRQQRQQPMMRTLETSSFPEATFTVKGPVNLGKAPAEGESLTTDVPGTFTIHGTSKDVSVKIEATIKDGVLVITGSAPFTFADYGLTKPASQIVVSLEDSGTIEFQLYLTNGA